MQTPFVRPKRMRVVGGDPWETDQPDSLLLVQLLAPLRRGFLLADEPRPLLTIFPVFCA